MSTQQETIKKFVKSLADNTTSSGITALNKAVNYASNGLFTSWEGLVDSFISDIKKYGGTGSSSTTTLDSTTNSFLKNYCGIVLNNDDTGAITGYDAGGNSVKNAEDIVPESTTAAVYPTVSSSTYNGVTITWPEESSLTTLQANIIKGLYTWWFESAFNLVEETLGLSFNSSGANSHAMTITFSTKSTNLLASANNKNITIYTNNWSTLDITGGSNSGKKSSGSYFDRVLAHELTHAVFAANVTNSMWNDNLVCVDEGLAELTHGADDGRRKEIIKLAQAANADSLEAALYYDYDDSGYYNSYAGGYMLLRYFAKQVSDATGGDTVSTFSGTALVDLSNIYRSGSFIVSSTKTGKAEATFTTGEIDRDQTEVGSVTSKVYTPILDIAQSISAENASSAWQINGTSGNDTLIGGSGNDTLKGNNGDDSLIGNAGNDYLSGGAGNDTLDGGSGANTLVGGTGADYFIITSSDDVIVDFTEGVDYIKLDNGSVTNSTLNGSDVILTINDSDKLTVKYAKDKNLTITDSDGVTTNQVYGNGLSTTLMSVKNSQSATINAESDTKIIDASKRTAAVNITGNDLGDTLIGGSGKDTLIGGNDDDSIVGNAGNDYLAGSAGNNTLDGGAGNDTLIGGDDDDYLYGGKGNDSLTGGAGNDTFAYGSNDGSDIITDYTAGSDVIKFTSGKLSSASVKSSDIIIKNSSSKITVKGGANTPITINDVGGYESTIIYASKTASTLAVTDLSSATVKAITSIYDIDAHERTDTITITGNSKANLITGGAGDDTIKGGSGKDTIYGSDGNDIISGGVGADYLSGGNGDDSLSGGSGNDTLYGGAGDDTLYGGSGKDVFIYDGQGNDLINDYNFSLDQIMIPEEFASSMSSVVSGRNVIFNIGDGTLTVKNGKSKSISINTYSSTSFS